MAYEQKISDVTGSVAEQKERRQAAAETLIGAYPTDAELGQSILPTSKGEEVGFFSSRGVRFATAWWLNHFAEGLGGDASKVPDEDIAERVRSVIKKMNRAEDLRLIADEIRKARAWYAGRQKGV
jgi:hypothetical protein